MKIGVLAGHELNLYATALLSMLDKSGFPASFVLCEKKTPVSIKVLKSAINRSFIDKARKRLSAIFRKGNENSYLVRFLRTNNLPLTPNISLLSKSLKFHVLKYHDINGEDCIRAIRTYSPDILIYCSGGILRQRLLISPRIGVLNAHMGFLPKYRGMNVLEWSLFYNDPIGVTVHFINAGIDTGEIILKRGIECTEGDTIHTLREKSLVVNIELLLEAIHLIDKGVDCRKPNTLAEGKQYFVMHPLLKAFVEKKIKHLTRGTDCF